MAFDANDLSPHELFVVDRTREGEVADFTPMSGAGATKPSIRAGFLRKLLLQLDPAWAVRSPGVRLKSVRIGGALDLTDCSGAGGAGLPALSLEACDIAEGIDLSHARLARLSLKRSRLSTLIGAEVAIDAELDLTEIAPLVGADGAQTLIVRLRGARIDGDVLASGAKLARANDVTDPDVLFLQGADIAGNVALVLFLALGIAGVLAMNAQGALVTPDGRACDGAIEPALYAIDVALPVIDLGQKKLCSPGRAPRAELFNGFEIPNTEWRLFKGAADWKWTQAAYALLGAILAALATVTFSGVMKPKPS